MFIVQVASSEAIAVLTCNVYRVLLSDIDVLLFVSDWVRMLSHSLELMADI